MGFRSRHRISAPATGFVTPSRSRSPAGRMSSSKRGLATWRTTSVARTSAGFGGVTKPARDDHRAAVGLFAVHERLAGVHTNPQRKLSRRAGHGAPHVDCATHRCDGTGKRHRQAVAGRLDLRAAMLGNRATLGREVFKPDDVWRIVCVAFEERCGTHQVGEQDRYERLRAPGPHNWAVRRA